MKPRPVQSATLRAPADFLPDDVATLKAMTIATQLACPEAEAKARNSEAEVRVRELWIEKMKFTIAKLRHERFGQSAERSAVLEQLELSLAELEEGLQVVGDHRRSELKSQVLVMRASRAAWSNRIRRLSKMESTSTKTGHHEWPQLISNGRSPRGVGKNLSGLLLGPLQPI